MPQRNTLPMVSYGKLIINKYTTSLLITLLSVYVSSAKARDESTKYVMFHMYHGLTQVHFFANREFQGEPVMTLSERGLEKAGRLKCKWYSYNGTPVQRPDDVMLIDAESASGENVRCDDIYPVMSGYLDCGGPAFLAIFYTEKIDSNRFSIVVDDMKLYFNVLNEEKSFWLKDITYIDFNSEEPCP